MNINVETKTYTKKTITAGPIQSLGNLEAAVCAIMREHPDASGRPTVDQDGMVALSYVVEGQPDLKAFLGAVVEFYPVVVGSNAPAIDVSQYARIRNSALRLLEEMK